MRASQIFPPMVQGDRHNDDGVVRTSAPASAAVPIPRRWLASIQSMHTNGGDTEPFHASPVDVDHFAGLRNSDYVVEQRPAGAAPSSPKRNAFDGCDGFGANTVSNHVVGQSPSTSHQNVDSAAGGEWRTDEWLADPSDTIPIIPSVRNAPVNTLLVSNVSRSLSQEEVLRYWPRMTYNYDLLYLAFEARKRRGSGWLFINFESHEEASEFRDIWHDQVHPLISRTDTSGIRRPLKIDAAKLQGLGPNVAHWQCALRRHVGESFVPAVFVRGQRVDFWQYADRHSVPAVLSI